jgi:hypothetical protein
MSLKRNIGGISDTGLTPQQQVLQAAATPSTNLPSDTIPFQIPQPQVVPPDAVASNVTPVAAITPAPAKNNTLLYVGLGIGALLLLSKENNDSGLVGDTAEITGMDKTTLVGIGVVAAIAAVGYWLYTKNQPVAAVNTSAAPASTSVPILQHFSV